MAHSWGISLPRHDRDKPVARIEYGRNLIILRLPHPSTFLQRRLPEVPGAVYNRQGGGIGRWEFPLDARSVSRMMDLVTREFRLHFDDKVLKWLPEAVKRTGEVIAAFNEQDPPLQCDDVDLLLPYQRRGIHWAATAGRGLIGDDMGLGKTVQGIKAIQEMERRGKLTGEGPYLVVCPSTLIGNWVEEINKWYGPTEPPTILKSKNFHELKDPTKVKGWYITNWEKVPLRLPQLQGIKWQVILGDESHRMKNRDAKRTKAMIKLGHGVRHRFLLSGTPAKNNLPELWTQLHFVNPLRWPSFWKFVDRYCAVEDDIWGHKNVGDPREDMLDEWHEVKITTLISRKTDDPDVEIDLPPVRTHEIPIELGKEQRRVYDQMLDQFAAWLDEQPVDEDKPDLLASNAMVQLGKLKQIATTLAVFGDPAHMEGAKLDYIENLLTIDEPHEKFVIMSQYQRVVNELCRRLREKGISHARLDGDHQHIWHAGLHGVDDDGTKVSQRQELASAFQMSDKDCKDRGIPPLQVFVSTIQTGGEGLTLTAARNFVFIDQMWSPADNDQAWKRIHRISQSRTCYVTYLMAKDTVDYLVAGKVKKKSEILDAVFRASGRKKP